MRLMSLERDIKKTIEYAAKFGCQINKGEIENRLISKNIFSKKQINDALNKFKLMNEKNHWELTKNKKAKKLAKLIKSKFGNILFLGISGSVAAGHPKKNDDIDIVLITLKNKLWITRFQLRWFIFINKIPHRKYGQKEKGNEFCFNLWLDEDFLKIPKSKKNLKNAVDLILLIPLINKRKTYENFLIENDWAKKYVATGYDRKVSSIKYLVSNIKKENNILVDKIVNWLMFWPQFLYMKKKIRNETVGLHQAFFHRPMIK